jgi:spore coat protein CotH
MSKCNIFPILIGTLLLTSCTLLPPITDIPSESETESESEIETEEESESPSESGSTSEEDESVDLYDLFYDHSNTVEIKLDFKNNVIYKLAKYSDDENKKEMYHPVDVTIKINGTEYFYEECGARMKGNTSRNPNFVTESGEIKGLVHFKISFNQTFDDAEDNDYYIRTWESKEARTERKDRRFGGAKKIDIKYNKCQDGTYTKQMYAYDAFRDVGVLVEKNNLVRTTIKTETDSVTEVYLAQECIDKEFLQRRMPKAEAKGNLYKSTYTSMGPSDLTKDSLSRIGVEGPNYHPSYDLKTNDDPDEIDHTLLTNLITTINDNKTDASTFKNVVDNLVDVDSILRYLAMCWVMGNPDDSRNNYNNFYIYFNSETNKAIFIPYDFDRCLGILQDWEIHMEDVPFHSTKAAGNNRTWQKNPLLWRLILKTKAGETSQEGLGYAKNYPNITEYRNKYIAYCEEFAKTYLSTSKFQEYTNNVALANKNINNAGGSNMTFENYATTKLNTFTKYPDN